jgi:hypothetical protein
MAKEKKAGTSKVSLENFQEEVRKRAEEIYKERVVKNKPGDSLSDWLQAEKEIKRKYGI